MHSSVYRKVLVAMTCALVLGAVGSASASASSWWAGGNKLASSEPLASSTTKVTEFEIVVGPNELAIECSEVGLKGADIASPSGGSIEHLVLWGCEVEPLTGYGSKCRLGSHTVESKALTLEAKLGSKSPEDELVVRPVGESEVLAEFSVEGSTCPFYSKNPVQLTGEARLVLPKGREEAVEQPLRFTISSSGELRFDRELALLRGEYKLKLSSGKGWSYH
jgi:hypothetical protein